MYLCSVWFVACCSSDSEAHTLNSSMAPPMGGKNLTGYSLRDHLITPQTKSVQPIDSSSSAQGVCYSQITTLMTFRSNINDIHWYS